MQCGKVMIETFALPDFNHFYFSEVRNSTYDLRVTALGDVILYVMHLFTGVYGLQVFRVFVVCFVCAVLLGISDKSYSLWHLILIMLFVVGTYQKQILRNSIFSFALLPVVLYIWYRAKYYNNIYIWLLPLLLGVWQFLHGAYLVGFGVMCALLTGDIIDMTFNRPGFMARSKYYKMLLHRKVTHYLGVMAVSYILIALYNPITVSYFPLFPLIKNACAANFLPELISYDFTPPYAVGFRVYTTVTAVMVFIAVIFIFRYRFNFAVLLPFLATMFVALKYLRAVGYLAVMVVFVIFILEKHGQKRDLFNYNHSAG